MTVSLPESDKQGSGNLCLYWHAAKCSEIRNLIMCYVRTDEVTSFALVLASH